MTAEIAALDNALARAGETVTLSRVGKTDVTCRAVVRGIKAEELIGTATTSDLMVIISPTGFESFGLPWANDKAVVKGKSRSVKFVDPIYVNDIWVRANMIVGG